MDSEQNNNSQVPQDLEPDDDGEVLEWTTHPLRRRPWTAVFVTVFILLVSALVFLMTYSKAFAALALVVLFASLAKFYLPTKFRLTDRSVTVKSTTQTITKKWPQYRSYYPDKNGVLLSPFAEPSRLENFRGIYLIFDRNRDKVLEFISARVGSSSRRGQNADEKAGQ